MARAWQNSKEFISTVHKAGSKATKASYNSEMPDLAVFDGLYLWSVFGSDKHGANNERQ